jgi:miniconductance mechanosensitive channel
MGEILINFINSVDWHKKYLIIGDLCIKFILAAVLCYITGKIAGKLIYRTAKKYADNDLIPFNRSLIKKNVFRRLTMMFPFIILYFSSEFLFTDTPRFERVLVRILSAVLAALGVYTANAFIDALDHYYQGFEVAKKNPIKGYLQMVKIFLTITGLIIILSTFLNRSPWGMLSGLGAMTALVILVFKDWILGLVASIQINANKLVVIGDSIEMEKYGVSGEVVEIALSTVKVKNWDNTISMIPAYSLISETFKNWHGVKESGGRRIKRVIYMDISSITFPDEKTMKRLQKVRLLKDTGEMKKLLSTVRMDRGERINKSGITNAAIFRKYVELYLSTHSGINTEKTIMAKLLEPGESGIPLQIYAFTNIIDVVEYEVTVADIFEHIIAVIPEFGLKIFQKPSGADIIR